MKRFVLFLTAAMLVIGGGAALGLSGGGPKSTHAKVTHAKAHSKVIKFHRAANLGTGLRAVRFGHGLSAEMVCSTLLTLRFRSTGEDGIIGVTGMRSTGGPQDDNTLTPLEPTTTNNTLSATDTDFDRGEALFVTAGPAQNSSITGSFAYRGAHRSVITGNFIGAFITEHGDCDLAGTAVVSARRPR